MLKKRDIAFRCRLPRSDEGSVLVPCLFIMSLLVVLTLSVQRIGGTGISVSHALAEKTQARMAAQSGLQIAYSKLSTDLEYTGAQCTPFVDASTVVDITVTPLAEKEFEVVSRSTVGKSESVIRTRVCALPYFNEYPLSVGNNAFLKGTSKILGDCCEVGQLLVPARDLDGDGARDLVVGSNGAVHLLHGTELGVEGMDEVEMILADATGIDGINGFGFMAASGADTNCDGLDDLLVASALGESWDDPYWSGGAHLFGGR